MDSCRKQTFCVTSIWMRCKVHTHTSSFGRSIRLGTAAESMQCMHSATMEYWMRVGWATARPHCARGEAHFAHVFVKLRISDEMIDGPLTCSMAIDQCPLRRQQHSYQLHLKRWCNLIMASSSLFLVDKLFRFSRKLRVSFLFLLLTHNRFNDCATANPNFFGIGLVYCELVVIRRIQKIVNVLSPLMCNTWTHFSTITGKATSAKCEFGCHKTKVTEG